MSNPGVFLLDEGIVNNKTVRIEDNLGEAIHIHIDDIRISLTVNEFYTVCEEIEKATKELFYLEGLEWERIDETSLDWGWLADYENISSIEEKKVRLGDLYTVKAISAKDCISKIVKLKDSTFVNYLNGKDNNIEVLKEKNMYQDTPASRLYNVLNIIKTRGYPYDNKYIMIDENKRIYDGDHRAACLFVLYGEDAQIPVLVLKKKLSTPFKQIINENRKKVAKYYIKKFLKEIIMMPKKIARKEIIDRKIINKKDDGLDCRIAALIKKIDENDIDYYVINKKIVNDSVDINVTLIVRDIEKVKELFGLGEQNIYNNYSFLYSVPRPIFLKLLDGNIAIWDRLSCKSAFENAILPMDKKINDYMWRVVDEREGGGYIKEIPMMLYVISNCILEKHKFEDEDIEFIKSNSNILKNLEFKTLLEKVFFKYSCSLLECLMQEKYAEAIIGYRVNREY